MFLDDDRTGWTPVNSSLEVSTTSNDSSVPGALGDGGDPTPKVTATPALIGGASSSSQREMKLDVTKVNDDDDLVNLVAAAIAMIEEDEAEANAKAAEARTKAARARLRAVTELGNKDLKKQKTESGDDKVDKKPLKQTAPDAPPKAKEDVAGDFSAWIESLRRDSSANESRNPSIHEGASGNEVSDGNALDPVSGSIELDPGIAAGSMTRRPTGTKGKQGRAKEESPKKKEKPKSRPPSIPRREPKSTFQDFTIHSDGEDEGYVSWTDPSEDVFLTPKNSRGPSPVRVARNSRRAARGDPTAGGRNRTRSPFLTIVMLLIRRMSIVLTRIVN